MRKGQDVQDKNSGKRGSVRYVTGSWEASCS